MGINTIPQNYEQIMTTWRIFLQLEENDKSKPDFANSEIKSIDQQHLEILFGMRIKNKQKGHVARPCGEVEETMGLE